MKKKLLITGIILLLIAAALIIYPHIEFEHGGKLYRLSYTGDWSEYENNFTLLETHCYYEKRDISLYGFDVKNFLCFHVIIMEYEEGDVRETEFILEEEYIHNFLENATIKDNPDNIDLAKLIEGKEAVVGNTRYLGNDYETSISYILDGRHEILYVFYVDDLLVIQVGLPDEGSRFIAYK